MAMFESSITEPIKQNAIKMLCCSSKVFRAKCLKGQGNTEGNTMAERTALAGNDKATATGLLSDQRGAASLEMTIVSLFVMLGLLLPLTDVAAAGFRYVSAWQALRAFGQNILYNPPPDVTNASAWTTDAKVVARANANTAFPITNIQLFCGDANSVCSAGNLAWPRYSSYTTTVTVAPMVLSSLLCTSTNANPCSFTLRYSEQFE